MFQDTTIEILGNSWSNTPIKSIYVDFQDNIIDVEKECYKWLCTKIMFTDKEPLIQENFYIKEGNKIYKIIDIDTCSEHIEAYLYYCMLKDIKVNNADKKVLIEETTEKIDYLDEKIVISDFEIKTGSIIGYQGYKWFVTSQIAKDSDMYRCRITKIEDKIKLYIKDILHEIPCIITVNSIGTKENQWMSVVDGNIVVTIQDNEITQKLEINNKFIKFKSKWEITGFSMEQKGLIKIYSKKLEIGADDNRELEIADYYKHQEKHSYSIEVENELNLKLGDVKQLSPVIKDMGKIITMSVVYTSSDPSIATVSDRGLINCIKEGACNIKVVLKDYPNIEQTISLTIKSSQTITYEYTPTSNIIPFGMQKSYSIYKYIDSEKQADTFTFRLNLNGKDPSICKFTAIDGNKFTIDAKKNMKIAGTITIEILEGDIVVATKDFTIKYL